jgi:DNA-binding IclR family transcriptional regulator
LAAAALGERDLVRLAQPILTELAARTGLSAYLTMLSGTDIVYLLQELPDTPLVSNIRVGSRVPAHFTAPGRVLLGGLSGEARRALLGEDPLAKATEQTAASHEKLDKVIAEDEAGGCAWSFSAYERGVTACAAPVRDAGGKVIAAISVAGPESGFAARQRSDIEKAVKEAARLLSRMAGGGGTPANS